MTSVIYGTGLISPPLWRIEADRVTFPASICFLATIAIDMQIAQRIIRVSDGNYLINAVVLETKIVSCYVIPCWQIFVRTLNLKRKE